MFFPDSLGAMNGIHRVGTVAFPGMVTAVMTWVIIVSGLFAIGMAKGVVPSAHFPTQNLESVNGQSSVL